MNVRGVVRVLNATQSDRGVLLMCSGIHFLVCAVVSAGMLYQPMGEVLASDSPVVGVPAASSTASGAAPAGARDGDRFSLAPAACWRGVDGAAAWWWQVEFPEPQEVGAILQVNGDQSTVLAHAPRRLRVAMERGRPAPGTI